MADSPLEEMEIHEHAEHAEHAAHEKDSLLSQVTLTIAILAVIAAIGASLETTEGDSTIVLKNEAVLAQNQATDQWNLFQAKSTKKNLYTIAAQQGGPKAADFQKVADKNATDQLKPQQKAEGLERVVKQKNEEAEVREQRHHKLTISSTLLHMAIAIATLAIILHRRWPWLTALALAAAGLGVAAWAYL
ncbi:MAG: DUF4337 family protein [Caulobacteraceae bacterium]